MYDRTSFCSRPFQLRPMHERISERVWCFSPPTGQQSVFPRRAITLRPRSLQYAFWIYHVNSPVPNTYTYNNSFTARSMPEALEPTSESWQGQGDGNRRTPHPRLAVIFRDLIDASPVRPVSNELCKHHNRIGNGNK